MSNIQFTNEAMRIGHIRRMQFDVLCKNARFPDVPNIVGMVLHVHYDFPGTMAEQLTHAASLQFGVHPETIAGHIEQAPIGMVGYVVVAPGHPWHGLQCPPGVDEAARGPVYGKALFPKPPSKWKAWWKALFFKYPVIPSDPVSVLHKLMRQPVSDLWEIAFPLMQQEDMSKQAMTTAEREEQCRLNVERVYRLALTDLENKGLQPVTTKESSPLTSAVRLGVMTSSLISGWSLMCMVEVWTGRVQFSPFVFLGWAVVFSAGITALVASIRAGWPRRRK